MAAEGLTARQTQILKALIDEYIDTAEPVGSLALEKKYNLGVSPATIRNEMVNLTELGYLRQPHTSAGRIPSPLAMKFYINQLMEENQISLVDEVKAKEKARSVQDNFDQLMHYATETLAHKTGYFSVGATDDGRIWSHGHASVFNNPEFYNYQVCKSLFSILDQNKRIEELFFQRLTGMSPIEVLFGEELGWEFFEPVGVVAARFNDGKHQGAIAIFGPYRLDYASVIPMVRYFGNLIQEFAHS